MIKTVILYGGYVEDSLNSALVLYHPKGFSTKEEVFVDLKSAFAQGLEWEDGEQYFPECCTEARELDTAFCPKCGNKLKDNSTEERLRRRILDYMAGISDGNNTIWEALSGANWNSSFYFGDGVFEKGTILIVHERADTLIQSAGTNEFSEALKTYRMEII